MKATVKREIGAGGETHVYRNRTAACLVSCRCHGRGVAGECESVEKPLAQSRHNRRDSIFSFCKSSRHRTGFDAAVL